MTPVRHETPDWLMLIYALLVMLMAQTVYRLVSRRTYVVSRRAMRRAMRYSEGLLELPDIASPAPVPARARSSA